MHRKRTGRRPRKRQLMDRFTHGPGHPIVAVAGERVLQLMPHIKERATRMNHGRARATSCSGLSLRNPLQSGAFHREYAQPVAAEIRSKQTAANRVEEQAVGMRRAL